MLFTTGGSTCWNIVRASTREQRSEVPSSTGSDSLSAMFIFVFVFI
jgi:hypothetical protein